MKSFFEKDGSLSEARNTFEQSPSPICLWSKTLLSEPDELESDEVVSIEFEMVNIVCFEFKRML